MKEAVIIDIENNRIDLLDTRFYRANNGEIYPSVTTILEAYPKSYGYYQWLKQVGDKADEIRDEFGNRGSTVHSLTENYDLNEEVNLLGKKGEAKYSSIEWSMFERYVEFSERFEPEIEHIESNYCSSRLGFGGTLDRVMLIPSLMNERILVDIKTSNNIHNHYWLQMAAYVKLFESFNQEKISRSAILWLNAKTRTNGKEGDIQGKGWKLEFSPRSIDEDWSLFQATHKLWIEENKSTKPRNISYKLRHYKKPTMKAS